jgi:hypothetical protein
VPVIGDVFNISIVLAPVGITIDVVTKSNAICVVKTDA